MKNLQNVRYAIATIATVAAVGAFATKADAQTQAFTAGVTVLNTLTLVKVSDLNFGTLAVARGSPEVASIAIDTEGVLGAPAQDLPAYIAIINSGAATAAEVTVAGGAPGANINVNIPIASIVNPISGLNSFTLDTWTYSWNDTATDAIVPGIAEVVAFDGTFGAGINKLEIGATLTTTAGATAYTDAAYAGSFNVVFSY